ncbi:NHLP bacteriocin export ABC transporter permease/ATPase subunit [Cohnella panacarvi]|uniref:NHLP bacteriocin export ABC transporter permease/ATPase subunit n=1 Tax=Cohnella panacarvi TaxID=400776 RepID=UPI0004AFF704|nr:NHLP bacteriocin export ABC transporter permease/ATPase subunit [Cohnella panacarvi]
MEPSPDAPSRLAEQFRRWGTPALLEGNNPLLIKDEDNVWYVSAGHVDLFAITLHEGEVASSRRFLFGVDAGGLVLGFAGGREASDALLVSGLSNTEVYRMEAERFYAICAEPSVQPEVLGAINGWMYQWSAALGDGCPPSAYTAWEEACSRSEEGIGRETGWIAASLSEFHRVIQLGLRDFLVKEDYRSYEQLQKKTEYDRSVMHRALRRLTTVSKEDTAAIEADEANPNDLLIEACKLVAEAVGFPANRIKRTYTLQSRDPINDIARASGIRCRKVALKNRWWEEDNGPLLAYVEDGMYPVALIPNRNTSYWFNNPANGVKVKVTEQLANELAPIATMFFRPLPSRALRVWDILQYSAHPALKRDFLMILVLGIAGGVLGTFTPIANGMLFDTIIPAADRGLLLQMCFILVSISISLLLFQITRSLAMLRIEGKVNGSIQAAIWDRLLQLPLSFFRSYTAGDLALRASSMNTIRQTLSGVVLTSIFAGIFSSFNLVLLFLYDLRMALVASLIVLAAMIETAGVGMLQYRRQKRLLHLGGKLSGTVLQLLNGIAKFRMAAAEKRAFYIWAKLFGDMKASSFKSQTLNNAHAVFNAVFPLVASMILFYMALSGAKVVSAGQFIAFFAAFSTFLTSMLAMTSSLLSVVNIIPLYERAKPIMLELPEIHDAAEDSGELVGAIEIKHVSFRYKSDQPAVLNQLSLDIRAGQFVALVGASGCGKSTVLRLLLGFEKSEAGAIYYDGQDMRTLDVRSLRSQFGVVLQNGKLMSGDIFTNIVGSSNLTMSDAWEAARMAGIDEDIRAMPMGMHTVVSEGGGTFSGGQRQRLLIARAIARKPRILLFDEATSALDNRTQAIVGESLAKLHATRVVIAHRLSTIMNADRIYVLDQGRIAQAGTYSELMNQEGPFAELAKRQLA